jgi:K+-transporting ATPase KdpF subunit
MRLDRVTVSIIKPWLSNGRGLSIIARRPIRADSWPGLGLGSARENLMSNMYWLSGLLALLVFGYLLYALFRAERF